MHTGISVTLGWAKRQYWLWHHGPWCMEIMCCRTILCGSVWNAGFPRRTRWYLAFHRRSLGLNPANRQDMVMSGCCGAAEPPQKKQKKQQQKTKKLTTTKQQHTTTSDWNCEIRDVTWWIPALMKLPPLKRWMPISVVTTMMDSCPHHETATTKTVDAHQCSYHHDGFLPSSWNCHH